MQLEPEQTTKPAAFACLCFLLYQYLGKSSRTTQIPHGRFGTREAFGVRRLAGNGADAAFECAESWPAWDSSQSGVCPRPSPTALQTLRDCWLRFRRAVESVV